MLGLILDPSFEDSLNGDGPNSSPGPYMPYMDNGLDGVTFKYRVLTQGYIAITLRQLFASTEDLTESMTIEEGDPIYMSIESGKLSCIPPTETGEVVRIVGYIAGLSLSTNSIDSADQALIYFNPSPVWLEVS